MAKAGILGAGTFGTALARMLANSGHEVSIWSHSFSSVKDEGGRKRHKNLPDMIIPSSISFHTDISEAVYDKDIVLFAVPSVFVRETASAISPYISSGQIIVDVAKGIECGTLLSMTGVIKDELSKSRRACDGLPALVALSGPTHAEEIACDLPSAIVSASDDIHAAGEVQDIFMNTCMRVYTNADVKGVELCGALKNIMALSSGIIMGLGFGDNARAALITRGMAEIRRLGLKMDCAPETFSGLAGIGDLIVTATSMHSRNNRCGILIGQGRSPEEAVREIGMVVEGINSLAPAKQLMEKYHVSMPITSAVDSVIYGGKAPGDAVWDLMGREKKPEGI